MKVLPLLLVLATAASAQDERPRRCLDRRDRASRNCQDDTALLRFAPTSGTGLPVAAALCDVAAGYLTGPSAFCLNGSGSASGGSQALSTVGTPTSQSLATCPNGPDCSAIATQMTPTTASYFKTTGTHASAAGDFSVCWLGRPRFASAWQTVVGRDDGSGARNFYLDVSSTGRIDFTIFSEASITVLNASAAGSTVDTARHLVCGTYDFVTDGTSVMRAYVDGTQVDSSTSAVGPMEADTTATFIHGRDGVPNNHCTGCIVDGAFFTEQALSAAQISGLARAVLADTPTGTKGQALTMSRGSAKFCANSAGSAGTTIPVNRPCVAVGLENEGPSTNQILRSQEIDHALWQKRGTGAASANATVAPDGTLTAERVTGINASGVNDIFQITAGGTASAALEPSFYIKRVSTSGTLKLTNATSGSAGGEWSINMASLPDAWTRITKLHAAVTVGTAFTANGAGSAGLQFHASAGGPLSFDTWGVQQEQQVQPSGYIATAGTTVTRATEPPPTFAASTLAGLSLTEGCTRVTWTPRFSGAHTAGQYLLSFRSDSTFRVPYINASSQSFFSHDGVHIASEGSTFTAGTSRTVHTTWSAALNRLKVTAGGAPTTTAFTTFTAPDQLQLLNLTSTGAWPAVISDVVIANGAASCGGTP